MKNSLLLSLMALLATHAVAAPNDEMIDQARQVAGQLLPKMQQTLQENVQQYGPAEAIHVCREMAPKAIAGMSDKTGWQIRRVSLKPRHADRAHPDDWEQHTLKWFEQQQQAGVPLSQLEKSEVVDGVFRYARALPVKPLCMNCHAPENQLLPAVKQVLSQHYPQDQATGYEVGQIRGALSLRKAIVPPVQ